MFTRVLIPLDGSPFAEHVLSRLRPLISTRSTELLLLRVISPYSFHAYASPELVEALDPALLHEQAREYLDRIAVELRAEGFRVEVRVLTGDIAEVICEVAKQTGADLIAMSTHGRTGVARWVLGSIADRVVRTATQPVFLDRQNERSHSPLPRRVLVPLDGSELAQHALTTARDLARATGATLVLHQAVPPLEESYYQWADHALNELPPATQREAAERYLERVRMLLAASGVSAEVEVVDGHPVDTILNAAAGRIDLVVMSTHGRSGVNRWVFGSVADKVLHGCPVPLILVRAPRNEHDDAPAMADEALL